MKIGVKNTIYQLFLAEVYIVVPEILVAKCCLMFSVSACMGYARFFLKMEQFGPEHEPIAMN